MKKLLIWLMLLSCTGCSSLPAEERAFAVVLMVEKDGQTWRVYGRIPTYQTGGGYTTVTGEGQQLSAALAAMEASAPMTMHLSQLRLLALDASLGEECVTVLQTLADRADMRLQCSVAMTDVPGENLMAALTPQTGTRLSKMMDVLLDARREQGYVLPVTLAEVIRMGERQTPVLMALTLRDDTVDVSGGYALGAGTVLLTAEETVLLSLLTGDANTPYLLLEDGGAQVRDVHGSICLDGLAAASAEITLQTVETDLMPEELEASLAGELLALLTRLSQNGCDVPGLGRWAICGADTMEAWHALGWKERLRDLRWTVSVGVQGTT